MIYADDAQKDAYERGYSDGAASNRLELRTVRANNEDLRRRIAELELNRKRSELPDRNRVLLELIDEVHQTAVDSGWWPAERLALVRDNDPDVLSANLALIHSEISEALECVRDGEMTMDTTLSGKPEGFHVELMDALIRIMDLIAAMRAQDEALDALHAKLEYNKTREHRHGGKAL